MLLCFISLCTVLLKHCSEFLEASDLIWFIHFEWLFIVWLLAGEDLFYSLVFFFLTCKLGEKICLTIHLSACSAVPFNDFWALGSFPALFAREQNSQKCSVQTTITTTKQTTEERLMEWDSVNLEKRVAPGGQVNTFWYIHGVHQEDGDSDA